MWHTSRGDRTLRGAEASLVAIAIDTMIDALLVHLDVDDADQVDPECDSGIDVYDALTACQRIGQLHDAAHHLLRNTPTTPPLSAIADATIAAIFVEVQDQVTIEIDMDDNDGPSWRQAVLDACQMVVDVSSDEEDDFSPESLPSVHCTDMRVWVDWIDRLASAILWDRDFEMADSFLDVDPGVSQERRHLMGISDDYFTSVAPDPRPEEAFTLISQTRDLLRSKPR